MSYRRVIPRDLFNEASLLKCYGRLWILLDNLGPHAHRAVLDGGGGSPFRIVQSEGDGSLTIGNLPFTIGRRPFRLFRPLNSRAAWPLYAIDDEDEDAEEVEVFTEAGDLTPGFLALIA